MPRLDVKESLRGFLRFIKEILFQTQSKRTTVTTWCFVSEQQQKAFKKLKELRIQPPVYSS